MRNCMRLSIVPFVITRVSAMAKTTPTHVTSYLVTRRAVDYPPIVVESNHVVAESFVESWIVSKYV